MDANADAYNQGRIFQLNVSQGGVPKLPRQQALLTHKGLASDAQEDQVHHGGPERALCLFSLERILALQAEGHPIFPGAAGENLTISGLDWTRVLPGTELRLGAQARVRITAYATPCSTIAPFFHDGRFKRLAAQLYPGWSRVYARVLADGELRVGDKVTLCS